MSLWEYERRMKMEEKISPRRKSLLWLLILAICVAFWVPILLQIWVWL